MANHRSGSPLAVVIGAGGMAMAITRLLGHTYRIMLTDKDEVHLEHQIDALRSEGHDVVGARCDVTDSNDVAALAKAASEIEPPRAIAHVVGLSPSMADGPTILKVNLVGAALTAAAFLPLAQPGSTALYISSVAPHLTAPNAELAAAVRDPLAPNIVERIEVAFGGPISSGVAYQLSKWAVIELCQRAAPQWGRKRARILSLSPGLIATPMGAREFQAHPEKRQLLDMTPLGREGTMTEIAEAVDFLLSNRASFITGTDILIDGGLTAAIRHRLSS